MRARVSWCIKALLLTAACLASQVDGGSGIVYGKDYAYFIKAPEGWIFDNESGVSQGLVAVVYPAGSNWRDAKVVLYSSGTDRLTGLDAVMAQDLKKFQDGNPKLEVEDLPPQQTQDGRSARIRRFSGDRFGNEEMVAYVDLDATVAEVVLTCNKDPKLFEESVPAFEYMVASLYKTER